jgi:hypothetical protein
MSTDFRFAYDAVTFRVKSRIACGCPDPAKSIRKLSIGSGGGGAGGVSETSAQVARTTIKPRTKS